MTESRLTDYLGHIRQAAADACAFVEALTKDEFLADKHAKRGRHEHRDHWRSATKIMDRYPDFVDQHPEVPWRSMRGMRNRIAHGYFDINLDVVWDTVQAALPQLLRNLPDAGDEVRDKS